MSHYDHNGDWPRGKISGARKQSGIGYAGRYGNKPTPPSVWWTTLVLSAAIVALVAAAALR